MERPPQPPAEEDPSSSSPEDFNFFEEEFQVQLALAISVSDPGGGGDAETAQIKAAKQISLGRSPDETLVDSLSRRYWSYNFVNYDEKVLDGFYDIYGFPSNPSMQGKMPLLLDLLAIPVSDNIDFEVVSVNRVTDPALCQLEESVYATFVEHRLLEHGQTINCLIQKIADLVVGRMGGPVCNADEMLKRWTLKSCELRNSLDSIILPLGCLDFGLSRHRALLFKVLADRINLPCMLVKGSYYTGTDEGAVNLVKFDSGSEFIIDLMGAPGTLIPAELSNDHLQHSELNITSIADYKETVKDLCPLLKEGTKIMPLPSEVDQVVNSGGLSSREASTFRVQCKSTNDLGHANQTAKFETDFGSLFPSLCRSNEGFPRTYSKASDAQMLKVDDVSNYVISASKNPEFAHKLHAVLLESGSSVSADVLSDMNPHNVRDFDKLEKFHVQNEEKVALGTKLFANLGLSRNEQSFITCTGMHTFSGINDDAEQPHAENLVKKHLEFGSALTSSGLFLPFDTTDDEFMSRDYGKYSPNKNDTVRFSLVPVDTSVMDASPMVGEQSEKCSMPFATELIEGLCKSNGTDGPYEDKKGKVFDDIERETETCSSGLPTACSAHAQTISPFLGDASSWEISWEELQIGERIGIGSYGEVYHAEWNATEVAVKKFMDQDISGDALTQFKCEVEIMLRVRHPNLVLFMGAVTRPPNLSILTEYLPRGSLFRLLHRPNNHLDEKKRLRMAVDVAKGMNYLHTSHPIIVHRDLKTPNLLVDKNWVVKVCDFGMSRLKHHTFLSSKSTAGTPEWMAPEVLRNEPSNEKSDVYSFGVILWELATLRVPWSGMNSMQVVGAVGFQNRHLDITEAIDPIVAEIILHCWHPNAQLRPSFGELIARLKCLWRLQRPVSNITDPQSG